MKIPLSQCDVIAESRQVEQVIKGRATQDGAGVKLTRLLLPNMQRRLDPFLMLDAFGSNEAQDYIAGFPNHPHRGFETITYMLEGKMKHEDNAGNVGLLNDGDVQWMNAGRGVIHSEMPQQVEGRMAGFQLWLNAPSSEKMSAPWYRDIPSHDIPEIAFDFGVSVRVIAGNSHGVEGSMQRPQTQPTYLDIQLPINAHFSHKISSDHHAFLVVYEGQLRVGSQLVDATSMAVLTQGGDGIEMSAQSPSRCLLITGRPINEPIVQYGPFVMNTEAEIAQAINDYRQGLF